MVMCYVIFISLFSFQNHWNVCKFEFTSAIYTTSEFRVFNLYIFLKVCTVIMVIRQYDVGGDGENSIWEQRLDPLAVIHVEYQLWTWHSDLK